MLDAESGIKLKAVDFDESVVSVDWSDDGKRLTCGATDSKLGSEALKRSSQSGPADSKMLSKLHVLSADPPQYLLARLANEPPELDNPTAVVASSNRMSNRRTVPAHLIQASGADPGSSAHVTPPDDVIIGWARAMLEPLRPP